LRALGADPVHTGTVLLGFRDPNKVVEAGDLEKP